MKNLTLGAACALVALSSAALEPTVDDFWDTRNYTTVAPNVQTSAGGPLDTEAFTCAPVAFESFDSCTWTLHQSNALRVFRSTPATGFIFKVL